MPIPNPPLKIPSLWPKSVEGVLNIAQAWYDPHRVAVVPINQLSTALLASITPPPKEDILVESAPSKKLVDSAAFAIAMNSINYRFWDKSPTGEFVRYENNGKIGALAMTEAFQKSWADPKSPLSLARSQNIPVTVSDIQALFGEMPDLESRVTILNEVLIGDTLYKLANEACDILDGEQLLGAGFASTLADAFPIAYGDEVLKKAQLATSFVWREAHNQGYRGDCNVTAFADYQIPNVLRAMGVLKYAPELARSIDKMEFIEINSPDERAIRAASILAVEQLSQTCGVDVADVDFWIWLKRREPKTPFHLTNTTAY